MGLDDLEVVVTHRETRRWLKPRQVPMARRHLAASHARSVNARSARRPVLRRSRRAAGYRGTFGFPDWRDLVARDDIDVVSVTGPSPRVHLTHPAPAERTTFLTNSVTMMFAAGWTGSAFAEKPSRFA